MKAIHSRSRLEDILPQYVYYRIGGECFSMAIWSTARLSRISRCYAISHTVGVTDVALPTCRPGEYSPLRKNDLSCLTPLAVILCTISPFPETALGIFEVLSSGPYPLDMWIFPSQEIGRVRLSHSRATDWGFPAP
jgi:hypothetical protein